MTPWSIYELPHFVEFIDMRVDESVDERADGPIDEIRAVDEAIDEPSDEVKVERKMWGRSVSDPST